MALRGLQISARSFFNTFETGELSPEPGGLRDREPRMRSRPSILITKFPQQDTVGEKAR